MKRGIEQERERERKRRERERVALEGERGGREKPIRSEMSSFIYIPNDINDILNGWSIPSIRFHFMIPFQLVLTSVSIESGA